MMSGDFEMTGPFLDCGVKEVNARFKKLGLEPPM